MGTYHTEEDAVIAFIGNSKRTNFCVIEKATSRGDVHGLLSDIYKD